MRIEEAKEKIKRLEGFIQTVESYQPQTFEQEAIKCYVLLENVREVANELNEKGYRIGNRKVEGKDVSDIIRLKPADPMHELAKRFFKTNKKRANQSW